MNMSMLTALPQAQLFRHGVVEHPQLLAVVLLHVPALAPQHTPHGPDDLPLLEDHLRRRRLLWGGRPNSPSLTENGPTAFLQGYMFKTLLVADCRGSLPEFLHFNTFREDHVSGKHCLLFYFCLDKQTKVD